MSASQAGASLACPARSGRVALLLNDQDLQVQEACVAFFASLGVAL